MSDFLSAMNTLCEEGQRLLGSKQLHDLLGLSSAQAATPISVIIPSRNEGGKAARTVRSLIFGRSCTFPLEIVIVDDASEDGSCDRLPEIATESPNVSVIVRRLPHWSGIPYARNRGAEVASHPIYVITDANTIYPQNWDIPIREHLQSNRILAGTIVDEETGNRGYGLSLEFPSMGVKWIADPNRYQGYVPVAACTCTVMNRSLFRRMGGYDESLPLYGAAEPEFSVRAWLSGSEIVCVPGLQVRHRFRPSADRERFTAGNQEMLLRNYLRFAYYYLPDHLLRVSTQYYSKLLGNRFHQRMADVQSHDAQVRRNQLKTSLCRDFQWYCRCFIVGDRAETIGHAVAQPAAEAKRYQRNRPRIAVYTAIIGGYDLLQPAKFFNADFVCFTDDAALKAPGWRTIHVNSSQEWPPDMKVRAARRYKMLPQECLPNYDAWIWIDGNICLDADPAALIEAYLKDTDIATFKYPGGRNCLYDEADACIDRGKDDKHIIQSQMARYRADRFPAKNGLVETSIVLRKNTPVVRRFNKLWWQEVESGSRRDQLSFNYVSWKSKIPYAHIPGCRKSSPIASYSNHRLKMYCPAPNVSAAKPTVDLTLVLLNWKRPESLLRVLESIDAQTVRPTVFLWNNGKHVSHPLIDWQVSSSVNKYCWPRWAMGAMTHTRYVCSLDDDFAFADDRVLEDLVQYLDNLDAPDRLVGAAGVILDSNRAYRECPHVGTTSAADTPVDIVKGKLLACRTDALRSIAMVAASREDDIAISGLTARGRATHHRIPGLFRNRMVSLPEQGVGLVSRPEHYSMREVARRCYFSR